ncbi:MAG: type II secretion system F family protein [Planctomycetota bacterium]|nr:MAG: type II secretion system F family protein [Planctomycetota bacterium]
MHWLRGRCRARRAETKAELFDSIATMLEAGVPVVEAVSTLTQGRARGLARTMLVELRESLNNGQTLDDAMAAAPWWFDSTETAMVRAARASGEMPGVLRTLTERHQRAGALSAKVVGALTYPAVVACVGVGVVVFLSVRTLPELVGILRDEGVAPPGLTLAIIAIGRGMLAYGPALLLSLAATVIAGLGIMGRLRRRGWRAPDRLRRVVPVFVRRALLARAWSGLAELVRTGVPLVEALRITGPTVSGVFGGSLRTELEDAAASIERGSTLADSLADRVWFDAECRRLIAIGENAGEVSEVLQRLADRAHRAATRAVDRLASMLEPAVILVLAALIGVVVMGAVLPILKLQEIIG